MPSRGQIRNFAPLDDFLGGKISKSSTGTLHKGPGNGKKRQHIRPARKGGLLLLLVCKMNAIDVMAKACRKQQQLRPLVITGLAIDRQKPTATINCGRLTARLLWKKTNDTEYTRKAKKPTAALSAVSSLNYGKKKEGGIDWAMHRQ